MKKDQNIIQIESIEPKTATVTIEGTGTLCLNKMNARNFRTLTADDRKKVNEAPNVWEDVITSVHWRDPLPTSDTYHDCDEAMMRELLENNAPCISAFGLKKSFNQTVVRQEIDKYSTKFDAALNIIAKNNLIPVTFSEWSLDERLMSPKRGAPITVRLNHFSGWRATFDIEYLDNVFSLNGIVNIINMSGFSMGIGSGRTSGFGRYKVVDVK